MRKMKDSGIEWIGEIPEEWDTCKLLYVLREKVFDGPHETPNTVDEGVPFISVDSINDTEFIDLSVASKYISESNYYEYCKKVYIECGDVLFTKAATIGKTAIVHDERFMIWSPIAVLKADPKSITSKYLYYLLNCQSIIDDVRNNGSFNTQANVGMRELERTIIPVCKTEEQILITEHLDAKCAEIDALIASKEKTNDLLKELRQSIIYEAVTKGLDSNAPMKDSGIEWIGEIPEAWSLRKLKYCFSLIAGATPKSSEPDYWDGDIVWVTPADYKTEDVFISEGHKTITVVGLNSCATTIIPECSLIFSKRAPVGLVAINVVPMATNQGCIGCIPKGDVDTKYYYYLLSAFEKQFDLFASGTTFKEISAESFANFELPFPHISIQKIIAEKLDKKCAEIDSLIFANETTINKLKEYRQSIIYEAVTGKVEII